MCQCDGYFSSYDDDFRQVQKIYDLHLNFEEPFMKSPEMRGSKESSLSFFQWRTNKIEKKKERRKKDSGNNKSGGRMEKTCTTRTTMIMATIDD